MIKALLAIPMVLLGAASVAVAAVPDDVVSEQLNYATQGVKDVYYAGNNPAKVTLHHIRAFALHDPDELIIDYRRNSTLTFGPVAVSSGNNHWC